MHIKYDLPEASRVGIAIYDITGKVVRSWNMTEATGFKNIVWNGTNNAGQPVPSGVYIYRIAAVGTDSRERFSESRKMLLLK